MKSGTIGALYALDAIKAAGLKPTARIHFQSVIEEESTGVGALSTLQRGYRADACFIPEPTGGRMVRSQVGVIWFRLRVRGIPVHVAHAGSGSNAIMAAYHLVHALQKLEVEWNERAKTDRHFKTLVHPINFNPGIIKGGDWASSVPALSLALDLQPVRTDIDLQAFRFRLGLVKIVAEHAYGDDQRADDEIQDIAVAGHPSLHRPNELSASVWARTRF